jgi:hypothetical protein
VVGLGWGYRTLVVGDFLITTSVDDTKKTWCEHR